MNTKPSRALIMAVALNVILAAALAFTWWRSRQPVPAESGNQGPARTSPAASVASMGGDTSSSPAADSNAEPALAPVQLSPQHLQGIGVKVGTAQIKTVANDIRVTGNVDVNERQLATVQVRFPGWIRKVYADATYDYV